MSETGNGARRRAWPTWARGRRARLVVLGVVLVLVVVASAAAFLANGEPSRDELMERAGLIGKRELVVGVKDDQPGVGLRTADGQFEGFDIDIALMIAAELGFRRSEVRFVAIESEDRPRMQARDGTGFLTVDLVVASYSRTPEREAEANVTFSSPYLQTEQSVITATGHAPVSALSDLDGERVCTLSTTTSAQQASQAGITLRTRNGISECVAELEQGDVDAVTTDAAILAGFVARSPDTLVHHDIGLDESELWAVNTGGNEALRDLVDLALYDSRNDPDDQRWEDAFDTHLRPEQAASPNQQVAIAEQPEARKVQVREWPWDTNLVVPPILWTAALAGSDRHRNRPWRAWPLRISRARTRRPRRTAVCSGA